MRITADQACRRVGDISTIAEVPANGDATEKRPQLENRRSVSMSDNMLRKANVDGEQAAQDAQISRSASLHSPEHVAAQAIPAEPAATQDPSQAVLEQKIPVQDPTSATAPILADQTQPQPSQHMPGHVGFSEPVASVLTSRPEVNGQPMTSQGPPASAAFNPYSAFETAAIGMSTEQLASAPNAVQQERGPAVNGLAHRPSTASRVTANGYQPNGYGPSSHPNDPFSQSRYPPGMYPPNGYPPNMYPQNGYGPNGYPPNGYPQNGYPSQNYAPNGYRQSSYGPQGYAHPGYPQSPYSQHGPQHGPQNSIHNSVRSGYTQNGHIHSPHPQDSWRQTGYFGQPMHNEDVTTPKADPRTVHAPIMNGGPPPPSWPDYVEQEPEFATLQRQATLKANPANAPTPQRQSTYPQPGQPSNRPAQRASVYPGAQTAPKPGPASVHSSFYSGGPPSSGHTSRAPSERGAPAQSSSSDSASRRRKLKLKTSLELLPNCAKKDVAAAANRQAAIIGHPISPTSNFIQSRGFSLYRFINPKPVGTDMLSYELERLKPSMSTN